MPDATACHSSVMTAAAAAADADGKIDKYLLPDFTKTIKRRMV